MSQTFVQPIEDRSFTHYRVPYFIEIEPAAAVAAGAVVAVTFTVGPRDIVITHIGFSTDQVGVGPAAQQRFKVNVRDMGDSVAWGPARWLINAVTGAGPAAESDMEEMAAEWRFRRATTINVEFENVGALAATPTLVLHGYQAEENRI